MDQDVFNLDREFNTWFYDAEYPTPGQNRSGVMDYRIGHEHTLWKDYWMREAFKQGAQAMWGELSYTLGKYACAVEGLEPSMVTPSQVYDQVHGSLFYYVTKQLELFPNV